MSDCLMALQQCSLIGLDESPQLLRRSMLCSSNAPSADSAAPQRLNFTEDQGACQHQRPPAAGTDGSILAAAVAAQAGTGSGTATWLDCSLPLLASESPAIAGIKPPRSRFRRAAAAPAAGKAAAGSADTEVAGQQAAGHGDAAAASAAPDPPGQASAEASGFAAKECMPLGSYARGASDTDSQADCNPNPEAQTAADTQSAAAASQPKQQEANWDLLQQLLDDSSCSSLSCLPPAMAQQQAPTPAATPAAAAGQGMRSCAWQSPDAAGARELTRSVGSDITGFRGFWSATPGAESQAAFSPAPLGHPPTGAHQQQDGSAWQSPYSYASMQAAAGEDADAAAGVDEGADVQPPQQRNTALMMLLSLEDSAVLGRASCAGADSKDAAGEPQQRHSSPIPEGEPGAEQGSPTGSEALHAAAALEAAAAEAAGVASPDPVPGGQLLRQQDWGAGEMMVQGGASSSRYTADCWPSPDGSPGVLLSSPVLHDAEGMQAASTAPKTASRFAPAAAATPSTERGMQQQDAAVGRQGAASVHAASADDGSRASALRAVQQQRNTLEYSPIRGLTLWGDASMPEAAQHLAAAATAAADSPTWGPKGPHHQQQQGGSTGAGDASSAACVTAADQFEQLQRLLTSSSSSSDDWQDASPVCAEQQHLQQSPTGAQQQQLTSLQLLQMSSDLASSVASRLQARSPGLHVCVGGDGLTGAVEPLGGQVDSCPGGGTGSGSPAYYTPADTPQTEQPAMLLWQDPLPSGQQPQWQQEEQQEQAADGTGSPAHSPTASRTAAAAMAPAGPDSPAGAPRSAQGKPSPLRVRTMPAEEPPESPHGSAAKSPMAAAAAAAAGGGSSAGTPVSARGRASPLHLRASPAESVDSFYGAAAGDPYGSIAFESSAARLQAGDSVRRSISWQAFEGLGALLDGEHPPTPGSVACKKAWNPAGGSILAGSATSSRASSSGGSASNPAAAAPAQCRSADAATQPTVQGVARPAGAQGAAAGVEGKEEAAVDTAADLASLVSLLKQQLRQAELKCTQQQLSVNEARQLVLQKELEVKRLRAGLAQSEQEGNGCLEALDAALDIMTVTGTAPEHPTGQPADADGAGGDPSSASMSAEASMQQQALQEHNSELQSTLAEAGQQLDFFEAQLQQLTAEKAAVEQQLASMQERLDRQQAEHETFLQSELEEQQQQHEEEVGQLHERLHELRDQMQALRDAAAASKTAAEQSQAKASSLQQQLAASEEHTQGLSQQLEQLQGVLRGQESESAASSEQLSRQVAQLLAAQQELQQANARLLEAEAEYASNQLALGCRNQELTKQLQEVAASNKRLDEANQQLQAQNASLSQMVQSLRANNATHAASAVSAGFGATSAAATPTSTAQSRPPGPDAPGMEGPTPMRRRMASVNAQLERRVQELLQQKQALAVQVEQLQQQLGQQHPAAAAVGAGLSEQQQAAFDELQQQVEHLTTCNDELVQQLEELDWAHEQLQAEKLELQGRLSDLEQDRGQLLGQLQQLQEQAEAASTAAADAACSEHDAEAYALQVQALQQDRDRLSADCQQLQDRLAQAMQQLVQLQEQQDLSHNNTALFERCKELEAQVQHLQQQLQQRDAQAMRASSDAGSMRAAGQQQQHELQGLRQELQQLEQQQAAQQEEHAQQRQQLLDRCETLSEDLAAARQQLEDLQQQLDRAQGSNAQLAVECSRLESAAADAEASSQAAQEALHSLRDRNKSLVDQLVQMQLAGPGTPPGSKASRAVATDDRGAQTAPGNSADVEQQQRKRRWTLEAGVQVELGGTDAEQATAVQQLLLLQAQAQLHEMEEQNRQAAQRHVDAKQRIAQLQGSLTQQEAALQAAEQQLREAKQQHTRESGGLQRENDQLVRQLADSRVQLQVLQTANTHLEGRVAQQQRDLHQHATAAKEAQLKLQELTHQQHLDKLQVAAVSAELTACKGHTQQLVAAQEKEARSAAALQQKLQQAQQEGHKAAAAAVVTSRAAYDALEERLGREVQASREQVEQLAREKNNLMVELQQTKATVDCLEDSVRRLGQHNAHLVQQIKGAFTAADSGGTGVTAALAAAAGGAAAMHTPTSGFTSAGGASGGSYVGGGSSMSGAVGQQGTAAAAAAAAGAAGPVSPRTLHSIIAAATRVNEKNKKLKRQLQLAMQQGQHAA